MKTRWQFFRKFRKPFFGNPSRSKYLNVCFSLIPVLLFEFPMGINLFIFYCLSINVRTWKIFNFPLKFPFPEGGQKKTLDTDWRKIRGGDMRFSCLLGLLFEKTHCSIVGYWNMGDFQQRINDSYLATLSHLPEGSLKGSSEWDMTHNIWWGYGILLVEIWSISHNG